jgi:hypothetical protein
MIDCYIRIFAALAKQSSPVNMLLPAPALPFLRTSAQRDCTKRALATYQRDVEACPMTDG